MRTPRNERLASTGTQDVSAPVKGPERRCVLSRATRDRGELTRLAVSPDGLVLPDVKERAPGRGAWIGVDRGALEKALADGTLKRALARAFGTGPLHIPADLPARVHDALARRLLERLGLELRAGNLLMGSQRIEKAARDGRVCMLFHAADASADGAAKLDQAWRVGSDMEGSGRSGAWLPLDRAALSVALGRENVVHLAAVDREAGHRIAAIMARLTRYGGNGGAKPAPSGGNGAHIQGGHPQDDTADADLSADQEISKD